jgi:hypothetical protein
MWSVASLARPSRSVPGGAAFSLWIGTVWIKFCWAEHDFASEAVLLWGADRIGLASEAALHKALL